MGFFAAGEADLYFDPVLFVEIDRERHERLALALDGGGDLIDLAPVHQQLARTASLMVEAVAHGIFFDIGIDQKQLAHFGFGEGIGDIGLPGAQGFNLGAIQDDPGLKIFFDKIIIPRFAVEGDGAIALL